MAETTTESSLGNRILRHHSEFDDEEKGTKTHRLDTSSDLHFEGWQILLTGILIVLMFIFCGIAYSFCKNKMHRFRRRVAPIAEKVKQPEPDPISNDFSSDDPATTAVFGHPMTAKSWKAITPKLQRVEEATDSQNEDESDMVAEMEGNTDESNGDLVNDNEGDADLVNPDEDNTDEGNAGFGNENEDIADEDNVDRSNPDEVNKDADNFEVSKESITDVVVESLSDESGVINDKSENGLDIDENTERNQVTGHEPSGGLVTEGYAQKVKIDSDEEDIEEAIDVVNT